MKYILRLIDRDSYVRGVTINYTGDWIEEVITAQNAFKAERFDVSHDLTERAAGVREHEGPLVELVTIS